MSGLEALRTLLEKEWQVIKHIPTQHKHEKSLKILLNNTVIQRFYSSSILNENSIYLSFWQQ